MFSNVGIRFLACVIALFTCATASGPFSLPWVEKSNCNTPISNPGQRIKLSAVSCTSTITVNSCNALWVTRSTVRGLWISVTTSGFVFLMDSSTMTGRVSFSALHFDGLTGGSIQLFSHVTISDTLSSNKPSIEVANIQSGTFSATDVTFANDISFGAVAQSSIVIRSCSIAYSTQILLTDTVQSSTIRIQSVSFTNVGTIGSLISHTGASFFSSVVTVSGVMFPSTSGTGTQILTSSNNLAFTTLWFECVQNSVTTAAMMSIKRAISCNIVTTNVMWKSNGNLISFSSGGSSGNGITMLNSFLIVNQVISPSGQQFNSAVVGCSVLNSGIITNGINIGGAAVTMKHDCAPGTAVKCGASETASETPSQTPPSRTRAVTPTTTYSDSDDVTLTDSNENSMSSSWSHSLTAVRSSSSTNSHTRTVNAVTVTTTVTETISRSFTVFQSTTFSASASTSIKATYTCPSRTNTSTYSHYRTATRTADDTTSYTTTATISTLPSTSTSTSLSESSQTSSTVSSSKTVTRSSSRDTTSSASITSSSSHSKSTTSALTASNSASKSYFLSSTLSATVSALTLSHEFTLTRSVTVSLSQSTSLSVSSNESSATASVSNAHTQSISESRLITRTMAGSRSMSTSFPQSGTTSTTASQINSVSTTLTLSSSRDTTLSASITFSSSHSKSTTSTETASNSATKESLSIQPTLSATVSVITLSHEFTLTRSVTVSLSQFTSLSLSYNESSVTASASNAHSHSMSESQLITRTMAGSRSMSTSFHQSGTTSTTTSQTNILSTTATLTNSGSLPLSASAAPATSSTTMSSSPSLTVSFSRSPSLTAMTESRMQTLSTLLSVSLSTQRSTSTSVTVSFTSSRSASHTESVSDTISLSVDCSSSSTPSPTLSHSHSHDPSLSQSITSTTTDAATNSLSRTLSLSTSRETSSSVTLRITATNHYSHTNSSTKSRSDSLTPSYTDTASNSSSPSDSTSGSVTLSRSETPSGTATHIPSLSPSLEPTNSFHRTRSNTSTGTATLMPPPEPEVFTTIAKIAQAVSTTAAVGSAVSGGDVSNANILMLLSTIDCSGGGAMLSVAAKAVSVFGEYGFVAMGLINLGLLLGISGLHFCIVVCAARWRYGGEPWLAVSGERGYRFPFLTLLLVDLLVPQALFGAAAALTRVPELSVAFVVLDVVSLVVIAAIVCGREALLHLFVMPQITIHAYGRNLNLDAAEAEAPMNADGDAAAAEDSDFDELWLGGDVVSKPPPIAAAASGDVGDGEAPSCRSRARLLLRSVMAALSPTHYWEPAPLRISMGLLFTRQRSRGFVRASGLELWMALMTSVFVVVASAFDDVVCTAVTGVLGVLYVAAGVFLVATRLYRLPLDNIVVPVNYFSFAAVCLLKAVSQAVFDPQSLDNSRQEALKKAAEVLQMVQSVTLVLKVVGGMYMMWRERRLYQEELDTRETQLNDMLGDVEIDDTPSLDALQQEFADALEFGGPSTVGPRSSGFAVNVADLAGALRDFLTIPQAADLPSKSRQVEDAPLKLDLNSSDYFLSSAAFPTDEERAAMDASSALDNAFRAMDSRALASTKDTASTALPTAGRARRKSLKRSSKPNLRPFDWGDLF